MVASSLAGLEYIGMKSQILFTSLIQRPCRQALEMASSSTTQGVCEARGSFIPMVVGLQITP
jgi:hypothetical protein